MADEASDIGQSEETPEEGVTPVEETDANAESPSSGEGTPGEEQGDVDWQKRYKDLESTYTRTSMEAAQLREAQEQQEAEQAIVQALSDPDTQEETYGYLVQELGAEEAKAWAEAHGFEVDLDEDGEDEFRDPRVDQLLAEREREQATAYAKSVESGMEKTLDKCLSDKGLKREDLGDGVADLIIDAALTRGLQSQDGDVNSMLEKVFGQWFAAQDAAIKNYRARKRDTPAPPVDGSSGTPNPSLGNSRDRLALANQVALEAVEGS